MAIDRTNGITASEINNEFPSVIDGGDQLSKSISSYKGAVGRKTNDPNSIYVFPRGASSIKYSDFDLFERKCRIDVLLIAGGGGGGSGAVVNNVFKSGGGGGAGGLNVFNNIVIDPNQDCTIRVGASGTRGINGGRGENGSNSLFTVSGTDYRTLGGGGGGGAQSDTNGAGGGSGGGGGGRLGTTGGVRTFSNLNDNRTSDGRNGGSGDETGNNNSEGGGGGGKSGAGGNADIGTVNGEGGTGFDLEDFMGGAWTTVPNLRRRVAGGGGGGRTTLPAGGAAAPDGGGRGASEVTNAETGDNLSGGGGGGGCGDRLSSRGGSGLVVVRYRSTIAVSTDGTILTGTVGGINYVFHVFKDSDEINDSINFKILNTV